MRLSRIFLPNGLEKLGFDYTPPILPHRETQIRAILAAIRPILDDMPSSYATVIAHGPTGTGKTTTMRKIIELVPFSAKKTRVRLRSLLINCAIASKTYAVAQRMTEKIAADLPARGYSDFEMISRVCDELSLRDEYLLLILDDLDELIRRDRGRILTIITRIEEERGERRIFTLLVVRNLGVVHLLDRSVLSRLGFISVDFPPYSESELTSIIKQRIHLAFRGGAVSSNAIRQISYNSAALGGGDARFGIGLLRQSGLIAASEGSDKVLVDHVRKAQYSMVGFTDPVTRGELGMKEALILCSISEYFRENPDEFRLRMKDAVSRSIDFVRKFLRGRGDADENSVKEGLEMLASKGVVHMRNEELIIPQIPAERLYRNVLNYIQRRLV